jgi:hypothetical protein
MKKRVWQITFVLLGSLAVGIGFGQGCSKPFNSTSGSSDGASTDPLVDENGYQLDPNAQTLSLVYNKQVLDHLVSCSGIGKASSETEGTWASKRGAVSIDGTVTTITAPMLMAITTISGDVCRDLIEQEKKQPSLFKGVNWTDTSLPADPALNDAIRGLALSCWARPEEEIERSMILETVKSEFTGAISPSDAMLFLCTSMLASLDTMVME